MMDKIEERELIDRLNDIDLCITNAYDGEVYRYYLGKASDRILLLKGRITDFAKQEREAVITDTVAFLKVFQHERSGKHFTENSIVTAYENWLKERVMDKIKNIPKIVFLNDAFYMHESEVEKAREVVRAEIAIAVSNQLKILDHILTNYTEHDIDSLRLMDIQVRDLLKYFGIKSLKGDE